MIKNYLRMAYRNLMRHKGFSLINISGLALGMTCSILILLWVRDEMSVDRFHKDGDRLFRVMEAQYYPGADDMITDATPGPMAEVLEREVPEIDQAVRITWPLQELLSFEGNAFKVNGRYADPAFFELFSFPLTEGAASQVLTQPNTIVISETMAEKLYGTKQAVGKMLKVSNRESYKVSGVMKDVPKNSTLQFEFVIPFENMARRPEMEWLKGWGNNAVRTFVRLKPTADLAAVNAKIKPIIKQYSKESTTELFLQSVEDMYLYSDFRKGKVNAGQIAYVRLFAVVAMFILIIACINFMNLATARSAKRAKEVGVRKAIGANKSSLVGQFMVESILIAFLALFLSLNLTGIVLPHFNDLTGKAIELDLADPGLMTLLIVVALFTGLVSGSYPAFFLSSFDPVVVLKGTIKQNNKVSFFRKGLVVFQFILSSLLIVSTLVVYLQLHFIRTKNLGLNRSNMVYVPIEGELSGRFDVVKRELLNVPGITHVTSSNLNPLMVSNSTGDVHWKAKDPNADVLFGVMEVGYDFIETMDIQLKEGRDFSKEFGTDTASFIINEEAARIMQMKNPVGQWLEWDREGRIIGVMKDFHAGPMQTGIKPLVIRLTPGNTYLLFARLAPGQTTEALEAMGAIVQKHNPAFPFEYHFLDDDFESMYRSEAIIGKLTNYFAGIAIFISCLGLFGLALFTAEQRTKEIGIRKVLGASVSGIVFMLSKDFLKLVLVANVVALPLSWYLMNNWLQNYAYRTDLSWWIFGSAMLATFMIAMLTLSFHAVKTAVANPITSLRTE